MFRSPVRPEEEAKMSKALWGAFVVLAIAGLYFVLWHVDPLPGNHEAIGLGMDHLVHTVVGIVLLIGALIIFRQARRGAPKAASAAG